MPNVTVTVTADASPARETWGFAACPTLTITAGDVIGVRVAHGGGGVSLYMSVNGEERGVAEGLPEDVLEGAWCFAVSGESEQIALVKLDLGVA